jgi:hypothetical protein
VGDTVTFDKLKSEAVLSHSGGHHNNHHQQQQHSAGTYRAAHVQLADKAKRARYVCIVLQLVAGIAVVSRSCIDAAVAVIMLCITV